MLWGNLYKKKDIDSIYRITAFRYIKIEFGPIAFDGKLLASSIFICQMILFDIQNMNLSDSLILGLSEYKNFESKVRK